jgi:hypothetical protein
LEVGIEHADSILDLRKRSIVIVAVLLLVICAAACAAPGKLLSDRQENRQRAIRWAERTLNDIPTAPVGDCDVGYFPYAIQDAAVTFQAVLDKYGPDARMEVGLAKCLMRLGQYKAAMQLFRQTMTLTHGSRNAVSGYRSSREYWRMARQIASHLSRNRHLIQICPLSIPHRKPLWLATSDEIMADNGNLTAINLELYQTTRHGLRLTWHSSLHDPRFTPEEFRHIQLFAIDITGDDVPEAIVSEALPGGDCDPTHMDVFALHGEKMVPLFAGVSDYDIWLSDFNHDRRYQIVCSYKIGQVMCCADK